jgi:undecaprenyl-diphosphatase
VTLANRLRASLRGTVCLFALLARWVTAGETLRFDESLRGTVHGWATPALTTVMLAFTTLGSDIFLVTVGAILAWRWIASGHRRQTVVLAAVSLSGELLLQLLKLAFHRPRPPVFFGLSPAETYSFPSGHAFIATVFYGLVAGILMAGEPSRRKRRGMAAIALVAALLIGYSRVYLGFHYPSDVLGGWLLAAAWLALAKLTLAAWAEAVP